MKRLGLALLLCCGCGQVRTETRVERGPLLRTFEREGATTPGGRHVTVDAHWPRLTLTFTDYQLCQHERVETYAEDHITEKTAPSAGPQIATGISTSVIGIALFAAQGLFSAAPNTKVIDGGGNYGASDRTVARGWSYVALVLGLPALTMGLVGLLQSGEETKTVETNQVVSSKETRCHEHPAQGKVSWTGEGGNANAMALDADGKVAFNSTDLKDTNLTRLRDPKGGMVGAEDLPALEHFFDCIAVLQPPLDVSSLSDWPREKLDVALEHAHGCAQVPDAPAQDVVRALETELDRRRLGGGGEELQGPRITSFEEAEAAYQPQIHIVPRGDDPSRIAQADALVGQALVVQGILVERLEANIAVVEVGSFKILVFIPPQSPWTLNLDNGSRVDLIGVIQGRQTLGSIDGPLVRAVWMRPAM